ncbi:MAG: hypothetical protein IKY26_10450 [Erysipelotrichaceae bacterium]|nr:hypothetical protein [Erysipelotrichaceae bacterium]
METFTQNLLEQYQVDFNKNNDLLLTLDPEYEPVEMKRMSDTYLMEQFNKISNIKRKLVGYWKFTVNDTEYYFHLNEVLECDFIDINHVKMGPFELTRIHESEVKI